MTITPDLSNITLDSLIDTAILSHGFTPNKRDYYFHIEALWQKENYAGQYLVRFTHCYDLTYQTLGGTDFLKSSWDDCFSDYEEWIKAGEPPGYVWGTNWAIAYPGFSNVDLSNKSLEWSNRIGREMKELLVESEVYKINLIYHEWIIKKLNDETRLISQVLFTLKDNDTSKQIITEARSDNTVKVEELENAKGYVITPNIGSSIIKWAKRILFSE